LADDGIHDNFFLDMQMASSRDGEYVCSFWIEKLQRVFVNVGGINAVEIPKGEKTKFLRFPVFQQAEVGKLNSPVSAGPRSSMTVSVLFLNAAFASSSSAMQSG